MIVISNVDIRPSSQKAELEKQFIDDGRQDEMGEAGSRAKDKTLREQYPEEIDFFKRRFVWSSQTNGFYIRGRYDAVVDDLGRTLPKWQPFKAKGRWQPLYSELVDSLVEKHLDFERFCRSCKFGDRLAPTDSESAFWLGMMAASKTFADCIDLDSHDIIGWNPVPTRWHESRTGWIAGPYSYRYLPVVRPNLRFFQTAKVIYDHFPRRMWNFSSANFGLAVWDIYSFPKYNHNVYPAIEDRLQEIGLAGIEHYPRPARAPGSLGKCHRRPCGMDSGVITERGVITDPIEQIRTFMNPPKTPSFEAILAVYWDRLEAMYDLFLSEGESPQHTRLTKDEKRVLVEDCQQVIAGIKNWSCRGYVLDWDLIRGEAHRPDDEPDEEVVLPQGNRPAKELKFEVQLPEIGEYPEHFYRADLKAVAGSGQWVEYVKFLVENGFPAEDKFCEIISTLALWFGFVELFGEDRQRTKDVLRTYVITRNNGKITRLITGQDQDVVNQVDRIVDNVLDGEDIRGKGLFAEIRQKRFTGKYHQVYCFEPEIMGSVASFSTIPKNLPLYLICGGLIHEKDKGGYQSEWHYEPDLTSLPDQIIDLIKTSFKRAKRQLRQDKTTGRYPTLDSITKLFNYLYSGRKTGSRRASQKLLIKMGFPAKTSQRTPIFRLLEQSGLLYKGGYLSKTKSRLWTLDKTVIEAIWQERVAHHEVAS